MGELKKYAGQGGAAHQLMVALACAERQECDQMDADGPTEFVELDASVVEQINDVLGAVRDWSPPA